MVSLKHLRLREQRRQSLQKFAQKAPQPPALKPPSTARTAGRSDWAERRFRRQPFILLFVGASSISLVSAKSGENSLIPLRLLFPPNPLRWASAGALFSSANRLICLKNAEGASHMASESLLQRGFKSHSHKRLTFVFTGESGYTLAFTNRIAHTGSHGETGAFRTGGWYHYPRIVLRGSETLRGRDLKRQTLPLFGLGRGYSRRTRRACGTAMRSCASLSRGVAASLGCVIPLLFLLPH